MVNTPPVIQPLALVTTWCFEDANDWSFEAVINFIRFKSHKLHQFDLVSSWWL